MRPEFRRVSSNGRASASQAEDVGSIPITRSTFPGVNHHPRQREKAAGPRGVAGRPVVIIEGFIASFRAGGAPGDSTCPSMIGHKVRDCNDVSAFRLVNSGELGPQAPRVRTGRVHDQRKGFADIPADHVQPRAKFR